MGLFFCIFHYIYNKILNYMEDNKTNQRLTEELQGIKNWMKFLDTKSNNNKSFHRSQNFKTPGILKEEREDQYGSPSEESDDLLLGDDEQNQDMINDGAFIVITSDINGGLQVNMVEAEDENEALDQSENEMIVQTFVISESSLMMLISKLSQYLPEESQEGSSSEKPPFIDTPDEDIIDEEDVW